jgi:hypothetical protein
VEIDLAQHILQDYQKVRKQLKQARHEFLKEGNSETIARIKANDQGFKRKIKVDNGMEEQKRYKRKIVNLLNRVEHKNKSKPKTDQNENENIDINYFKSKFMTPIKRKAASAKARRNEEFLSSLTDQTKKFDKKSTDLKITRHQFHPPSKLNVNTEKHVRDFMGLSPNALDPMIVQRPTESVQNFQLKILESPKLRNSRLFQKYYSGGPPDTENELFQVILPIKLTISREIMPRTI